MWKLLIIGFCILEDSYQRSLKSKPDQHEVGTSTPDQNHNSKPNANDNEGNSGNNDSQSSQCKCGGADITTAAGKELSAYLIGSGVLSSLALTVALITAMPALLCVIKGNFCVLGLSIFFINAVVPPVFMFISFLLLEIDDTVILGYLLPNSCATSLNSASQSVFIIFGIVHLVPIPHLGLLEILFRNTFTAHRLGHYFGTTVLPVVNAVTLIVALIFEYGQYCMQQGNLFPIITMTNSIYFLLFIVSIIHGMYKEYSKYKKSLTLLCGTSSNLVMDNNISCH